MSIRTADRAAPEQGLLARLGWDDGWRRTFETSPMRAVPGGRVVPGRVCRADRGACEVLTASGRVRATWGSAVVAASAQDPEAAPSAGDWVSVATWPDDRVTAEVVLRRRTAVRRAQAARGSSFAQVVAANADVVAVVEGLVPDTDAGRLERLLALAWASGAEPVVVLTKADLVPDVPGRVAETAALAPGVAVLPVVAPTGNGTEALRERLAAGLTIALVGASGVGKSTLLNTLVGAVPMRTRDLRADGKGRHTTVTRELHVAPVGGAVVDTPGLRGVGLVGEESLEDVFGEVEDLALDCRFVDCGHRSEPGCAVLAAVEAGVLDGRRLTSYRKLQRESQRQAARADARVRRVRTQTRGRGYRS